MSLRKMSREGSPSTYVRSWRFDLPILAIVIFAWQTGAVAASDDISFAPKNFFELGDETVGISGTRTGDGVPYPNNTYAISCFKHRTECWVSSVQQIGKNQIGRLEYPWSMPVVSWMPTQIVASQEKPLFGCWSITITIQRKEQTALWVEEPVNRSTPPCSQADGRVEKSTIGNPPGRRPPSSQ